MFLHHVCWCGLSVCCSSGPVGGRSERLTLCCVVVVQSQTATRNAKTEIEILQRVNHVSPTPQKKTRTERSSDHDVTSGPDAASCLQLLTSSFCLLLFPLLRLPSSPAQPCLTKTEDFYQTDDCYYIVLEL